ncbi:MAG TPA: site-specific integrase [Mycobacteriales bacterium]|nr:site-specific integrase [Mycobacteriales bacterium]
MSRRRSFGTVRRLPSGRWQARYRSDGGRLRPAPTTFPGRVDAERYLAQMDLDQIRGGWIDPAAGAVALSTYAEQWLAERPETLRPRTVELYQGLLRRHILPTFGPVHLNRISSAAVRSWHASLRQRGVGDTTVAKSYRLLKGILNTAVEDDLIGRNPCRLRRAGAERPEERRPPSLAEVDAIAAAIEPRFRVLVLLAAWSGLRYGELAGLSRQRIDPLHGVIHVREQLVQMAGGRRFLAPPKTRAGVRTVALPPHVWPQVQAHLDRYVDPSPTAMVFSGAKGATLDRANLRSTWLAALSAAGVPHYRFHDLRHLSATLAAVSGATTRELMARMGHSSARAAMIYQHATADRDRAVAEAMSRLVAPTPLLPSPEQRHEQA